jgi:hypothetical protein
MSESEGYCLLICMTVAPSGGQGARGRLQRLCTSVCLGISASFAAAVT